MKEPMQFLGGTRLGLSEAESKMMDAWRQFCRICAGDEWRRMMLRWILVGARSRR